MRPTTKPLDHLRGTMNQPAFKPIRNTSVPSSMRRFPSGGRRSDCLSRRVRDAALNLTPSRVESGRLRSWENGMKGLLLIAFLLAASPEPRMRVRAKQLPPSARPAIKSGITPKTQSARHSTGYLDAGPALWQATGSSSGRRGRTATAFPSRSLTSRSHWADRAEWQASFVPQPPFPDPARTVSRRDA